MVIILVGFIGMVFVWGWIFFVYLFFEFRYGYLSEILFIGCLIWCFIKLYLSVRGVLIVRGKIKVKVFFDICIVLIYDLKNEKFLM